ncbi:MAG: hypothetical protein K2I32_06970 [Alistipes sp.]|nr:hypothetical protein [Alistipes sp.]
MAGFDGDSGIIQVPDWCPLETYKDAEKSEAQPETIPCYIGQSKADEKSPSTIILPGMPDLEWMTENLSGFGGTEIDGRWYYTYDEAEEAVKQLGNGWRLSIDDEFVALDKLGSTWDDERKGRWFGGNHHTDHEGSLFFPASGFRNITSGDLWGVGTYGYAWFSSPTSGSTFAGCLVFYSSYVDPLGNYYRAYGLAVRCVRDVK